MNFILMLKLSKMEIPLDYRRHIISFMKDSLMSLDEKYYAEVFETRKHKPFTFSVKLPVKKFLKDTIELNNTSIEVQISTSDVFLGAILSESMMRMVNIPFNKGDFKATLISLKMKPIERIKSGSVLIKFESPLIVQHHQRDKDWFYSVNSDDFQAQLKTVVDSQIAALYPDGNTNFKLTPVESKKTVIRFYEKQIEASVGTYVLTASPDLITFFLLAGIGSKRSSGFGKFKILSQGER